MSKAAVVILADTDTKEALGRVVNGLQVVKEFKEAGDEAIAVFDGAGTRWVPKLADKGHKYHELFASVQDEIAGACEYCAEAFGVTDEVKRTGVEFLGDFEGHPSIRELINSGYQVLTF